MRGSLLPAVAVESPSFASLGVRALEVECQTGRRRPDLCTADDLVGGIATADLVAMTARPQTIMRAWTLVDL